MASLPESYRTTIETLVFETFPELNLENIKQRLAKLKGVKNFYKIRVGDYRIGVFLEGNSLEFKRVLHRKEIYRYFP